MGPCLCDQLGECLVAALDYLLHCLAWSKIGRIHQRDSRVFARDRVRSLIGGNLHQLLKESRGLVGPKQFARVSRMEKVVAARLKGSDWADVAYAPGYNDQAHLINDFRSLIGGPPEAFFRGTLTPEHRGWNAQLAVSGFYNTFVA